MEIVKDESYGIIPVTKNKSDFLFLLVHQTAGHWGFPKGHKEKDESPMVAAKRELSEEAGIKDCKILDPSLFVEHYSFEKGNVTTEKTVSYFLGMVDDQPTTTPEEFKSEVSELKWLSYSQALQTITFDEAKGVLKKAAEFLSKL
jgi:bis(5'-nucleosidyl)-tetraphosphatase